MFDIGSQEAALLLTIVLLIFGTRDFLRRLHGDAFSQLFVELERHTVFSAETTRHKEAEFIRDSLPKRFPFALVLVAALLAGATLWIVGR